MAPDDPGEVTYFRGKDCQWFADNKDLLKRKCPKALQESAKPSGPQLIRLDVKDLLRSFGVWIDELLHEY